MWHCPVCAAKIGERRRLEVAAAIEACQLAGGAVFLATYTLRHNLGQSLAPVLDCLRSSHRKLKQGRPYQLWKKRVGYWGAITSLEVTTGANGWHPHIHELLFLRSSLSDHDVNWEVSSWLSARWRRTVAANGGEATKAHGFNLKTERDQLHEYITKQASGSWDFSHEMAKSVVKKSRGDVQGKSMMRLLYEFAFYEDQDSARRWSEYARTFKGRNHLSWSRGLRGELLGDESSAGDDELAAEVDPVAAVLASLTWSEWGRVLRADLRGELLEVASTGDEWAVAAFLEQLGVTSWRA